MNCYRRILPIVILLGVLVLPLLNGCTADTDTFDPYTVPVFSTVSDDFHTQSKQLANKLELSGNSIFRISDIGAITYSRSEGHNDVPIEMTDDEALRQAAEYLNELGLLPKEEYRAHVSRVNRSSMDLTGAEASPAETISIDVYFYRVFNGVDVISDQEDGIRLSFDAQGIRSLHYLWRNIETSRISQKAKPISQEDAHQIYLEQWDSRHGTCCEPPEHPEISSAYIQLNGVTQPCWVISEDKAYTNAWFIDMLSGEILY